MTDSNLFHEEPPGYGGAGKSSPLPDGSRALERGPVAEYLSGVAAELRSARRLPNPAILPMNWNTMHVRAREEICSGAAVSIATARRRWEDLEAWLQLLLIESMLRRTRGSVALGGDAPVTWAGAEIS